MEDKLLAITWCKALSAKNVWRNPSAFGHSLRAVGWETRIRTWTNRVGKNRRAKHLGRVGPALKLWKQQPL